MKKFSLLLLIFALILGVKNLALAAEKSADKWLIYWYISGNDLERNYSEATNDLQEMANKTFDAVEEYTSNSEVEDEMIQEKKISKVLLPVSVGEDDFRLSPNVKILIQTGGCADWLTSDISGATISRYVYDSEGFHYQGAFADADMGNAKTLEDFLRYGKETVEKDFQPTRRMFIFWGHGDLAAVCLDEKYRHDENQPAKFSDSFLDLNEIHQAFKKVFKFSAGNPPFEIIGFDACTRATYDNANNLYGFTRYMIASEELEDGGGWYYSEWIKTLSENPSISGKTLGTLICRNTYDYMVEKNNPKAVEATFSLIDLSPEKWMPLRKAYNSFNKNYFKAADKDPYIYAALDTAANNAIHYAEGNFDPGLMLDLKDFAEKSKTSLQYDINSSTRKLLTRSADDLIRAIDSAVVYNVYGKLRAGSNGISAYYPLSKDEDDFTLYASQNVVFKYTKELYGNLVGMVAATSINNVEDNDNSRTKRSRSSTRNWNEIFDLSDLYNLEVDITENDDDTYEIFTELTKDQMKKISNIQSAVALEIEEGGNAAFGIGDRGGVWLGTSSNINLELVDDKYRLSDTLKPTWFSLNGHIIYAEVMETQKAMFDADGKVIRPGYTIYGVPIMLNEVPCLLRVAYYPAEQSYQIIGARPSIDKSTSKKTRVRRTTREFFTLKKGDKVAPLFLSVIPAEDSNVPDAEIMPITVDDVQLKIAITVGESFILEKEPFISEMPLGDSENYNYGFLFYSPIGNRINSRHVDFEILDGEIFDASKGEPAFEDDTQVKFIDGDEEYTFDTKTGKIYNKNGEEYIRDTQTGEMVKAEK